MEVIRSKVSVSANTLQIQKQMIALGYKNGDRVNLRAFYPEKGKDEGRKDSFIWPDIPGDLLTNWHTEGRGIYLVVNHGGHTDEEIGKCIAVFYEHDDVDEEGLKRLQGFFPDREFELKPPKKPDSPPRWYVPKDVQQDLWVALGLPQPTMQVDTGGKSVHTYWALREPVDPQTWKQLQVDLIELADADRKLKNPSRVMRLAGCFHAETGQMAKIIGGNGKSYSYDELRSIVPVAEIKAKQGAQGVTWSQFNESWRFPISDSVPLEACLSRANRDLLAHGQQDGGRNDSGFKLAADLLAVTSFLTQEGQRFDGDPYQLFMEYCQRCPCGDGWNQREWDLIWKSAQSKGRNSSLSPEQIEGCVKGWAWKHCPDRAKVDVAEIGKKLPSPKTAILDDAPPGATDEERLRLAIANYNKVLDSGNRFQQIPLRRAIAKEWGLTVSEIDELSLIASRGEASDVRLVGETIGSIQSEILERANGGTKLGLATGFYDLDAMTQGFQPGDLIVPAARPSMGKTAMMLSVARFVAAQKKPVLIFSLEMSKESLAYRLLSAECQIEVGRLRSGRIQENEWDRLGHAISNLSQMPIYIDDTPAISTAEIRTKCRHFAAEIGQPGIVMIDYLQMIAGANDDPVIALDRITGELKALGRELNTPMMVLSQLSRSVDSRQDKRPTMSDLRGSGGVEQNADLIVMLYRDEYYNPETPDRGIAELIIVKHRNGPTGTVKMLFENEYTRFLNLSKPVSERSAEQPPTFTPPVKVARYQPDPEYSIEVEDEFVEIPFD